MSAETTTPAGHPRRRPAAEGAPTSWGQTRQRVRPGPRRLAPAILCTAFVAACDSSDLPIGPEGGGSAPLALEAVSASEPFARAGRALPDSIRVRVRSRRGPSSGVEVRFTVVEGGGALSAPSARTGSDGTAAVAWVLGPEPALNRVTASVSGLPPVEFRARGWAISSDTVRLSALGDSMPVTLRIGTEGPVAPELRVDREARWLHDLAVVDPAALSRSRLMAAAPGSAEVIAVSGGVEVRVHVVVSPPDPIVLFVDQAGYPADPRVTLRGYRMSAIAEGSVRIAGREVRRIEADSARLVLDPGTGSSEECTASVDADLSVDGVPVPDGVTVRLPVGAPPFAVGETRSFRGRAGCLRLPRQVGRYVVAQVERSLVDLARDARESYWDTTTVGRHTFAVLEETGPAALRVPSLGGGASRALFTDLVIEDGQRGVTTAPSPFERASPWIRADTFSVAVTGFSGLWRVMREYPPAYVVATPVADSAALWTPQVMAKLDSVFAWMAREQVLRIHSTAFGGASFPTTSRGSGQLLVAVRRAAQSGYAACRFSGGRRTGDGSFIHVGSVVLGVAPSDGEGGLGDQPAATAIRTVAHELAHAYDCMTLGLSGPRWATEGLASFLDDEVYRDLHGVDLEANTRIDLGGRATGGAVYTTWAIPSQGHFTNGYGESASFLRHVAMRARERGASWEQARAAVVAGSAGGWFGHNGPSGMGLVQRIRPLDPEWDPVEARIDWVLSMAADDRADPGAERFQIPLVKDAWSYAEGHATWNTWGVEFHRGTLTLGHTGHVTGSAFASGNGYVLIEDPTGRGGALTLEADTAALEWRVLRIK